LLATVATGTGAGLSATVAHSSGEVSDELESCGPGANPAFPRFRRALPLIKRPLLRSSPALAFERARACLLSTPPQELKLLPMLRLLFIATEPLPLDPHQIYVRKNLRVAFHISVASRTYPWLDAPLPAAGGFQNGNGRSLPASSCAGLVEGWPRDIGGPVESIRPLFRKPDHHLVVLARGEGLAAVLSKEAPITSGQAAKGGQTDLARFGIRRRAKHEVGSQFGFHGKG
jgi:hypothetical protein